MDELKQILQDKEEYSQYMLGIEHIIIAAATNNRNRDICVRFNCTSAFHRRMVHLIATIYQLRHKSLNRDDKEDGTNRKIHHWFRGDENITTEERIKCGDGPNDWGPGHGYDCQDCSWKYDSDERFVEVRECPKIPKETVVIYWNETHPSTQNH